ADMRHARARLLPDRPAGLPNAIAPVDFLGVHEETLVQCSSLLDHLAARQDAGAERVVDWEWHDGAALARVAPVPPRAVQPARQRLTRREQIEQRHRQRREA